MTLKEFRKLQGLNARDFLHITQYGIEINYDNIDSFAQDYHNYKIKEGVGLSSINPNLIKELNIYIYENAIRSCDDYNIILPIENQEGLVVKAMDLLHELNKK